MADQVCYLVARSRAEENALRALQDVAVALDGREYVIIGGLMVMLLSARYPVPTLAPRATQDADVGVPTVVAEAALVHDSLIQLNYLDQDGNTYMMPGEVGREVNVLIPAQEHPGQRGPVLVAGRGFDAAPGLKLALMASPESVTVCATFLDGSVSTFIVKVPSLLGALVLKLCVRERRSEVRDLFDIHQLLRIRHEFDTELSESWSLSTPQRGERGDAQRAAQSVMKLKSAHYGDIQHLRMLLQRYVASPQVK